MARPLRIQYPDAVYHVTCRGNDKGNIFKEDADRVQFLLRLNRSLNIYSVNLHSYALMTNHFHLLIETPLGNLSEFMRHFNISYIGYYNRRHQRVGHLYQGRFKAILVDKDSYLSVLSRYIHLNPVRIRALEKAEPKEKLKHLISYQWSSLSGYLKRRKKQPFVTYHLVLGDYGGDTDEARKAYRKALVEEMVLGKEMKREIVGQTVIGGDEFIAWVKEKFLSEEEDREAPGHRAIKVYRSKNDIAALILRKTGKTLEEIRKNKGPLRQVTMDLLYRQGGLTNPQIGQIFGVDYSSVSQERKRLHQRLETDKKLLLLLRDFESEMTRLKK